MLKNELLRCTCASFLAFAIRRMPLGRKQGGAGTLLSLLLWAVLIQGCGDGDEPASHIPQQVTTKTGIEMVLIPGAEFIMGDNRGEDDEKPAHKVKINAFYMDKYEVTQEAYERMMGRNPAKFKSATSGDKPVEQVSWFGAIQYCNMRSLREGLTPCYVLETLECNYEADGYRLPTEAEWEYACRAGTGTRYSFGNAPGKLGRYAWFKENAGKTSHPVGRKKPNPWSLYDMHGNVWEWCNDYYSENYVQRSGGENPHGPSTGQERVLRGGSWASGDESLRSSSRYSETPGFADVCFGYEAYGFRCVRRAEGSVGASVGTSNGAGNSRGSPNTRKDAFGGPKKRWDRA